jgi:hypothetical protein
MLYGVVFVQRTESADDAVSAVDSTPAVPKLSAVALTTQFGLMVSVTLNVALAVPFVKGAAFADTARPPSASAASIDLKVVRSILIPL